MGLARQVGRFGVVGVAATLLDYAVLMALSQMAGVPVLYASAASYVVSLVFNYAASMRYVFTHREEMSRGREFTLFVVLSVIGLGINQMVMAACTAALGASAFAVTASKAVATAVVMVWNFASRKRWLDAPAR